MDRNQIPRPGEIYKHFKDKPYQIITVATHTETKEQMVVYQALYGDFKTYVRPLEMFLSEVDHEKYPDAVQSYRFEKVSPKEEAGKADLPSQTAGTIPEIAANKNTEKASSDKDTSEKDTLNRDAYGKNDPAEAVADKTIPEDKIIINTPEGEVNILLMKFLDAESYSKKLEVVLSNKKYIDDRLINDMAVALDCSVDEGPIDQRITGLVNCLQAMCRFEDRRLR